MNRKLLLLASGTVTVETSTLLSVALGAWIAAAAVSLLLTAVAKRLASRLGLVDVPDPRKVHTSPIPLGGGVAIWLSVCAIVGGVYAVAAAVQFGWVPPDMLPAELLKYVPGLLSQGPLVGVVLGAATVQMLLGLIDDWRGLSYAFRLAVEIVLVLFLAWCGIRVTLFPPLNHPLVSYTLTVLWVVGLTNAFNFLDNMDALSGGVAMICSMFLAAVAMMIGDLFISGFALVVAGALCGFLWHNWPPASIFMGDAGSNFVGFLLGVITVAGTFTTPDLPSVTILAPVCIMAVPIYDSFTVIAIRIAEGRSPFLPDKKHFSHRLVELGLTPVRAVLTIYLASAVTSLSAVMLYFLPLRWAVVALLQVGAILALVAVLETAGLRGRRNHSSASASASAERPHKTRVVTSNGERV